MKKNSKKKYCRICGSNNLKSLINFKKKPIVHHLKNSKKQKSQLFPFHLVICKDCHFQQIEKIISPKILYNNYFTLSSEKNQPHTNRFINVLENISHCKSNSRIIEIGCNDGQLLDILKKKKYKNLLGIEPTKDAFKIVKKKHKVFNNFFSKKFVTENFKNEKFDIIITRQVLEHINDLHDFMKNIVYISNFETIVAIEVPDHSQNLENLDYTLWEEHCNYFTMSSLENLLKIYNMEIIHFEKTLFSGRCLSVFAKFSKNKIKKKFYENTNLINKYKKFFPIFKNNMQHLIKNKHVAIYGCGARSSNFVNFLDLKNVKFFIDDQKTKQNKFVPGNNLKIVKYDQKIKLDIILLGVNTENEKKIIDKIPHNIKIYSILPPSIMLPKFWIKLINQNVN